VPFQRYFFRKLDIVQAKIRSSGLAGCSRSSYHFVIALLARAISGKITIQQVPGSGLKPFSVFPDLLPLTTRFESSQHLRLPAALPSERNWLLPYNSYTRSLAGRQLVIEAIIILTAAAIRPNGILNYYP
jgi:hypothetical protein